MVNSEVHGGDECVLEGEERKSYGLAVREKLWHANQGNERSFGKYVWRRNLRNLKKDRGEGHCSCLAKRGN